MSVKNSDENFYPFIDYMCSGKRHKEIIIWQNQTEESKLELLPL